ncbi:MAG: DNRLRE domain-containing protein [Planctomycetes bacterium]|nr:DNRLRE domain-containing protein [Planctomycetota bacterium]
MIRHASLCLSLVLALAQGAAADTVVIGAQKDNSLYGNLGSTSNGKGDGIFCGVAGNGRVLRGLLQFDVASNVPAGSTITSVQLTLTMVRSNAGPGVVQLRRVLQAWGEAASVPSFGGGGTGGAAQPGDATWTHAFFSTTPWATPGGSFSPTASATQTVGAAGSYTWLSTPNLVSDVQSFLDAPSGNFGWLLLHSDEVSVPTAKKFGSRENGTTSARPRLEIVFTPPSPFAAFCFGDGSGTACPCANAGLTGNGCGSSSHPNGANLTATGVPSISNDTLILQGSGMSSVGGVLYFQGSAPMVAGAGLVFGDGLLCAGGTILRLGVKINSGGASQWPEVGDPSISVKGLVTTPGSIRHYQGWYRDSAVFCNPETFNLTNGLTVTWGA